MEMITLSIATAAVFAVVAWVSAHAIIRIETGLSFAENAKQPATMYRYYDGERQCYDIGEKHTDARNTALGCGIGFGCMAALAVFFAGVLGLVAAVAGTVMLAACGARKARLATANI